MDVAVVWGRRPSVQLADRGSYFEFLALKVAPLASHRLKLRR